MSSAEIPFSFVPTDPSLKDLLDLLKKDILLNFNAHHVGTIDSFDADNQTVTATINYPKTYFKLDAPTGLYGPVQVTYPLLVDCPAIVLGGGTAALTFPITKGDECLVLFNDRDLDNWFSGGTGAAVATPRLHSFSDGIVLVGLRSMANTIDDYDTTRAVLRNGNAMVGVGTEHVKIANEMTTLKTLLNSLITDLNTLITQTAAITVICAAPASPSSIPVNAAAILAVNTSLATLTTQIAGLLE